MRNASDKAWGKALLFPLLFLFALTTLYIYVGSATNQNLLDNKIEEVKNELGMIAAATNANPADPWHSHEDNILQFMKFLDAKPLTFAAAYFPEGEKLRDESRDGSGDGSGSSSGDTSKVSGLKLLTERDNATNFDPREYVAFIEAVGAHDEGSLILGFTPTGGEYRDMHLYFLWVPDYSGPQERYLLVAAVSKFSITIKLARWITTAPLFGVIVLMLLCGWLIYLKMELGHIIGSRRGTTLADKHRPVDWGEPVDRGLPRKGD